ncbi:MAG: hypothetical protein IPO09_02250 [Anaeromyxobacter sp.]|nr:hypothetical protein [Anaeromyxobacter sp.]MBL0277543.1 hypothetical protein [Anaeromyxobacter sp.]
MANRFIQNRAVGLLLGMFSGVTLAWVSWAAATPGDFFGNGSRLLLPSLAAAAIIGGALGRTLAPRLPRVLVLAAMVSIAYWAIVPDGWWAKPPPGYGRRMP